MADFISKRLIPVTKKYEDNTCEDWGDWTLPICKQELIRTVGNNLKPVEVREGLGRVFILFHVVREGYPTKRRVLVFNTKGDLCLRGATSFQQALRHHVEDRMRNLNEMTKSIHPHFIWQAKPYPHVWWKDGMALISGEQLFNRNALDILEELLKVKREEILKYHEGGRHGLYF